MYSFSQQITNEQKFNEVYDELLKNYINTFKFFFKNGVNINQIEDGESFIQKILNTYFLPLIKFAVDYQVNLDSADFLHYSNFDQLNRQVMKFIYNENNYRTIEEFLKNKMKPKKIVIKKNTAKKVVQLN